jgi:DNA-binding IclR family transcriptional regulator
MASRNVVAPDPSHAAIAADALAGSDETSDAGRTVLKRIASIMDAFDQGEQSLTLVDLSQRSNLPKSTVHRLAEQLRALGWLERDHSGYRVGMRLFELGGLALQRNLLRDTAFPHLYTLASKTGLAVQLGVLDRGEVVYLERVLVAAYRLPTRLGGRMPAYCTGLGKSMLAFDDCAAEAVLASKLPRRTDNTITDPDLLRSNLAQVRASGVAFDLMESFDGLGCVAAPIRNSGRAIGAVSVTGPITRMDWDAAAEAVQHAAANIWKARFGGGRPSRVASESGRCHDAKLARTFPRPAIDAS